MSKLSKQIFSGSEGWFKDDLRFLGSMNPCSVNDQTPPCFADFTLWPFRAGFPCSPALQDGKGASTFGHQTLRISYVGSRHQNPGHQDLSGESHLIVSHSHVSRIIHGNQDRLGIPCWEDLVSLGANASIQNTRFS